MRKKNVSTWWAGYSLYCEMSLMPPSWLLPFTLNTTSHIGRPLWTCKHHKAGSFFFKPHLSYIKKLNLFILLTMKTYFHLHLASLVLGFLFFVIVLVLFICFLRRRLAVRSRALHRLSKHSITELYPHLLGFWNRLSPYSSCWLSSWSSHSSA